ncbi:hypothetical protein WN51_07263 [Melipona quadrifasciata]|uniref:Uncharacterized protein n=1 Tax=Melipona quadrifasciata TaxID=166423 RepID=A0A0M8ZQ10_9HYME|nr:hypothetical protein WN51_07263 [Melipona quadrifasciata]
MPDMLLNNEGQVLFLRCVGQYGPHQVIVNTARIASASVVNSRVLKGADGPEIHQMVTCEAWKKLRYVARNSGNSPWRNCSHALEKERKE